LSTIQELFHKGKTLLKDFPEPFLEARLLLLECASLTEEEFFSFPQKALSKKEERCYFELLFKRSAGFPLPYLTGIKEFWSIPFRVFPGVFIPRPETELIVEKVIEFSSSKEATIVDIGTGCGNIAISLAKELPQARIIATDISRKAIKAAKINASEQNAANVTFICGSLFSPLRKLGLKENCDFIISNPPYVSEKDWTELEPEIKDHEPKKALLAGETGLEVINKLIPGSLSFLKPQGVLFLEIGEGQRDKVLSLFDSRWKEVSSFCDLGGIERVVIGRKA